MDRTTKYYGCKNGKTATAKIISLTKDPNKWESKFIAYFGDFTKALDIFYKWNFRGHHSKVTFYMKDSSGKFLPTDSRTE